MKRKYFGTDGVRGPFNGPVINAEFAWRLGAAAGKLLAYQEISDPVVVIGRDTRFSGPILEKALAAGLASAGATVWSLGVVPTPAVSFAVRHFGAALGVVVTASHNPAADNGIKFFSHTGSKLDDAVEAELESLLPEKVDPDFSVDATPALEELPARSVYLKRLSEILPENALAGWKIAVDVCHGASHQTTPTLLRTLGADVVVLNDQPDGENINLDCGSQHPEAVRACVLDIGARLGIAHDGDADRVILVDENGEVLDGDEILAILAAHFLSANRLNHKTLVATMQSNVGLRKFMEDAGGRLETTDIGDRHVIARMLVGGFNLGGESSGHIICSDIAPCGDGLAAALLVLEAMIATGKPLSELKRGLTKFPQEARAIRVSSKPELSTLPVLAAAIAKGEGQLGNSGRILVRYSGTEPKIRLLVEGPDDAIVASIIGDLESAVREELPES